MRQQQNHFRTLALAGCASLVAAAFVVPTYAVAAQSAVSLTSNAPLFDAEMARAMQFVDRMMANGIQVPMPKDPGGGYTHELHKQNYRALVEAGELYRITGDRKYADYVRDMLLAYAGLYPKLGPHPARSNQQYGRLFWQNLNDAVWLVNAIQGYEAIRDGLSADDRTTLDGFFRSYADFMSTESVATFDRIHNHATWSTAGVGMTGYVIGDDDMVQRALLGSKKDGSAGFLKQMDMLFSPDGYYAEGPYYQRYALMPFMVFANAIDKNDPKQRIFERRDGILIKALNTAIQLTYNGRFMPFNDAIKEKSLNTDELYHGVAIGYAQTKNPELLSIAQYQNRVAFSPEGRMVAEGVAAGASRPFPFRSLLLSDGASGKDGAVAVLRKGDPLTGQALVAKNSSQGMGHGHFDKLSWQYFDNGKEVITDYGAARFLNIASKSGGRYLPENESWAKQTVAHNTLVVDATSHYNGDEHFGEANPATQIHFADGDAFSVSIGTIDTAYTGVTMTRTLAMVRVDGLEHPLIVDMIRADSSQSRLYDLPLHYNGHIIGVGPKMESYATARPVLGEANGYQHIWVDGIGKPDKDNAFVTWQLGSRFYTWRWVPLPGSQLVLAETGANDPDFNLRREPMILQRANGSGPVLFAGVLESHGRYDSATEQVSASESQIRSISAQSRDGMDVMIIETRGGARIAVLSAHDTTAGQTNSIQIDGKTHKWTGPAAHIVLSASNGSKQ